jgi:cytochrome b561
MNSFRGATPTLNASRIMRRLCKHWSHKYPVQVDETSGTIELPNVRCSLRAHPDRLDIALDGAEPVPERLKGVVAEHLQRMAGEETLAVSWEN